MGSGGGVTRLFLRFSPVALAGICAEWKALLVVGGCVCGGVQGGGVGEGSVQRLSLQLHEGRTMKGGCGNGRGQPAPLGRRWVFSGKFVCPLVEWT